MINIENCKIYCREDKLPLVEGYAEAVSSPLKYVLHHRAEIQPDGLNVSKKWLKEHHIYYGREPFELIFLEDSAHRKMHSAAWWKSPSWSDSRRRQNEKLRESKNTEEDKLSVSKRTKALWDNPETRKKLLDSVTAARNTPEYIAANRERARVITSTEKWKSATRNRKSATYVHLYGMTRKEIAMKLNINTGRVEALHRKGELKKCLA